MENNISHLLQVSQAAYLLQSSLFFLDDAVKPRRTTLFHYLVSEFGMDQYVHKQHQKYQGSTNGFSKFRVGVRFFSGFRLRMSKKFRGAQGEHAKNFGALHFFKLGFTLF